MLYRFKCGAFIEASTYEEAQLKFIQEIANEEQETGNWHRCTCTGLSHRFECPEHPPKSGEISY